MADILIYQHFSLGDYQISICRRRLEIAYLWLSLQQDYTDVKRIRQEDIYYDRPDKRLPPGRDVPQVNQEDSDMHPVRHLLVLAATLHRAQCECHLPLVSLRLCCASRRDSNISATERVFGLPLSLTGPLLEPWLTGSKR